MQKLVYHVASSLDGFIARSDGTTNEFLHQGEHVTAFVESLKSEYSAVIMGRETYAAGVAMGVYDPFPWLETVVFSRRFVDAMKDAPRVSFVANDVGARVRSLKAKEGRGVYLCGGGKLAASLFAEGLVDEVVLKVNPILLGEGIPLAPGISPRRLVPREQEVYENGVIVARYEVKR